MKAYEPEAIRNIAIVGHGGSGKTSLAEALLFVGKARFAGYLLYQGFGLLLVA